MPPYTRSLYRRCSKVSRATIARLLFAGHSMLAVWRLIEVSRNQYFWLFSVVPFTIFLEGAVTIWLRDAAEYKWFCPSIFIFLCGSVPPIWFLEMKLTEKTIHNMTRLGTNVDYSDLAETPHEDIGQTWRQLIEQTLLIILVLGRWLLPKGSISRDELSQLLLAYLAISSDIAELFNVFRLPAVRQNMQLTIIVLSLWSISLIQFPMVMTTSKGQKARYCWSTRRDKASIITNQSLISTELGTNIVHESASKRSRIHVAKQRVTEVSAWGIITTVLFQDGPFLALRIYLLFWHRIANYTMIFFVCKNALIISVQLYRLIVICMGIGRVMDSPNVLGERAIVETAKEYSVIFLVNNQAVLSAENRSRSDSKSQSKIISQNESGYSSSASKAVTDNADINDDKDKSLPIKEKVSCNLRERLKSNDSVKTQSAGSSPATSQSARPTRTDRNNTIVEEELNKMKSSKKHPVLAPKRLDSL